MNRLSLTYMNVNTFMIIALISHLCGIHHKLQAQTYLRAEDIPVSRSGIQYIDPWAGGLNSPQISRVDMNLDGAKDIVSFDRSGNKFCVFLNQNPQSGAIEYKYSQSHSMLLPDGLRNWALFRDMNCDGKEDLCTNTGSGIRVYWNESTDAFSLSAQPTNALTALYDWGDSQTLSGIFSISADIPAIDDYDGDGDMDIWSWNEMSDGLFFYKNMSVENGDCLNPIFECRNRCYGQFGESIESFSLSLGENFECSFNVSNPRSFTPAAHTGGTILTLDLDQNGLKDLIIGDVTANQITAITLTETSSGVDSAFAVHDSFPSSNYGNVPAHFITFLAGYYEDINNDNVKDLVIASNAIADASDIRSIWLYINTGFNDQPFFELHSKDFLQSQMLDMGTSAFPATADIDQNGLPDIIISSRKSFDNFSAHTSRLWYLHNNGTPELPSFEILDTNWLNIPQYGLEGVYPSFGDLDGDGDLDILLGLLNGEIHACYNEAGINNPMQFPSAPIALTDIENNIVDAGQTSAPSLYDIDENGTLDIVSGNLNGTLSYFKNTGSNETPVYEHITDTLGQVVATSLLGIQGRSVPVFLGGTGLERRLIIGTETGQINEYAYVPDAIEQSFILVTENHGSIHEGERAAIAINDFNNDNRQDLLVGNWGGGLAIYLNDSPQNISNQLSQNLSIFPNPTSGNLQISPLPHITFSRYILTDLYGRNICSGHLNENSVDFRNQNLMPGMYYLCLQTQDGRLLTKKIILVSPLN